MGWGGGDEALSSVNSVCPNCMHPPEKGEGCPPGDVRPVISGPVHPRRFYLFIPGVPIKAEFIEQNRTEWWMQGVCTVYDSHIHTSINFSKKLAVV